ncbi:V-type ATP synthase subunit F [Aerococcaceae bacterium DSM 111176]|nr:V-type ATP synthase subunit F [Aerococcaceae bacterium DSM 111176]
MEYKIAIIGEKDEIYAYSLLGMKVFYMTAEDPELSKNIRQLIQDGYGVLFITEKIAKQIPSLIKQYDDEFMPAIILIPSDYDATSMGLDRLNESVIKAVGRQIL